MTADMHRPSASKLAPPPPLVPPSRTASTLYTLMAIEVVAAVDGITERLLQRVRTDLSADRECAAAVAANLLEFRRAFHRAAAGIVEQAAQAKEERIERVRLVLGIELRVAAAFLLELIDEPGLAHCCMPGIDHSKTCSRRSSVYASHIRKALRIHGLESALITVRSRGYQLSVSDARRIRALWGE